MHFGIGRILLGSECCAPWRLHGFREASGLYSNPCPLASLILSCPDCVEYLVYILICLHSNLSTLLHYPSFTLHPPDFTLHSGRTARRTVRQLMMHSYEHIEYLYRYYFELFIGLRSPEESDCSSPVPYLFHHHFLRRIEYKPPRLLKIHTRCHGSRAYVRGAGASDEDGRRRRQHIRNVGSRALDLALRIPTCRHQSTFLSDLDRTLNSLGVYSAEASSGSMSVSVP